MLKLVFFSMVFGFCALIWAESTTVPAAATGAQDSNRIAKGYTIPMPFTLSIATSEVLPPVFEYDVRDQEKINLGGLTFATGSVDIKLMYLDGGAFISNGIVLPDRIKAGPISFLAFRWPKNILTRGKIVLMTEDNRVVMDAVITDKDLELWNNFLITGVWGSTLVKVNEKRAQIVEQMLGALKNYNYSFININYAKTLLAKVKTPIQFCLSQGRISTTSNMICSPSYTVEIRDGVVGISAANTKVLAKVKINGKSASLVGKVIGEKPINFYTQLTDGSYFQFITKAFVPYFAEVYYPDEQDKSVVEVVGYGDYRPIEKTTVTQAKREDFWDPTIGDFRLRWKTRISLLEPWFFVPGSLGFNYRYEFVLRNLPTNDLRSYIHERTPIGSYKSSMKIRGWSPPGVKPFSQEYKTTELKNGEWEWDAKIGKEGYNTPSIQFSQNDKKWSSTREVYRGNQFELGARLTALASNQKLGFLTDLRGWAWFEDILGWDNYYLSTHRWGFQMRKLDSFISADIQGGESGSKLSQSSTNGGFIYRFTPGIWGRDEFWGSILDYQALKVGDISTSMMGVGIIWARSMPYYFDQLFDWGLSFVGLEKREKWVNAQFIYYPVSLKGGVNNHLCLNMDFHGVLNLTKHFLMDGGLGIKSYSFSDTNVEKKVTLNEIYGTFGFAYSF